MTEQPSNDFGGVGKRLLDALFRQPFPVVAGSLVGAFGMLNLLDSLVLAYQKIPWALIPEWLRSLFVLFREATGYLYGWLTSLFALALSPAWRDYLTMGFIVAGMRSRSTMVIRRAVMTGHIREYREKIFGQQLVVRKGSTARLWLAFFAARLVFAFVLWPMKLFGASYRYMTGEVRRRGYGPREAEVREQQYLVFFGSVIWFVVFLLAILIFNAPR